MFKEILQWSARLKNVLVKVISWVIWFGFVHYSWVICCCHKCENLKMLLHLVKIQGGDFFSCTRLSLQYYKNVFHLGFLLETKWQRVCFLIIHYFLCQSSHVGFGDSEFGSILWTGPCCSLAGHTHINTVLSEVEMNLGSCRETFTSLSVDLSWPF